MPVSSADWIKVLSHISDAEQLQATVKGSFFGSFGVGIITMVFSLFLGPVGLLVGGVFGGFIAYKLSKGSYKPLSAVLKSLTKEQKENLFQEIAKVRSQITVQDYAELILLLQGKSGLLLKKELLSILLSFVKKVLGYDVS